MLKKYLFLVFFLSISFFFFAQNKTKLIAGKVFTVSENTPLPYANVFNKSAKKGTVSNVDGYFELEINSYSDSILISYIGYQPHWLIPNKDSNSYSIKLEESILKLNTVEVKAKDYTYLIDLILACKENQSQVWDTAKTYFQLKSYINNQQIELVENFYNASVEGYNLKNLELKAGRIGLQKTDGRLFLSLESSKAISKHNLFGFSSWFPVNPLSLSRRNIKKKYYVDLVKRYLNEHRDSIYVIKLSPKAEHQTSFQATIWINKNESQVLKVDFVGKKLKKHPFVPLFEDDRIANMNIRFSKTFEKHNKQMRLNHIDFDYDFTYISRNVDKYQVKTQALIQAYDFEEQFNLPHFEFPDLRLNDYQKIDALPYNEFFWNNHDELQLNQEIDSNRLFLEDTLTFQRQDLFSKRDRLGIKLLEQPFVEWSNRRIIFKEKSTAADTSLMPYDYELRAKIFLDYNQYNNKTDIYSITLLDPFDSYFKFPLDSLGQCFLNIYFDLIEIERRRMMGEIIKSDQSYETINQIYLATLWRIKYIEDDFFENCQLGQNKEFMMYFNEQATNITGIDNIKLFRLYYPIE